MICILALIVFGILGIFSATHRKIAIEAFDCVFRKITFRKCESRLDVRLKSQITGKLMKLSPRAGKIIYKYFEAISWAFVILFFVSTIYVIIGGYNFYLYGNCNGPTESGFCVFDPLGENSKFSLMSQESCSAQPALPDQIEVSKLDLSLFASTGKESANQIIFVGCYHCQYTREVYPEINELVAKEEINFIFAHLPTNAEDEGLTKIMNCVYDMSPEKFFAINEEIFESSIKDIESREFILNIIKEAELDPDKVMTCMDSTLAEEQYQEQVNNIESAGIYGTPTVFVNGETVVGPKPLRVYKRLLK